MISKLRAATDDPEAGFQANVVGALSTCRPIQPRETPPAVAQAASRKLFTCVVGIWGVFATRSPKEFTNLAA